jgi:hypothetical protein
MKQSTKLRTRVQGPSRAWRRQPGASLQELMGRMGHSTTRAALIYQHRTTERDRLIAAAMSQLVEAEIDRPAKPSGTQRARGGGDESDAGQEES